MATKNRIKYFDNLKCIAIMGVIFLHCFILWDPINIFHINANHLNQIGRFGVPLFIMISGALLLNREIELKQFFKKRFVRICYPLIFFIAFSYVFGIYKHPLVAFWFCWMILGAYLAIPIINIFIQHASEREIEYFILVFIFASIFYQASSMIGFKYSLDLNFFITPVSYLILGYYLSTKKFKGSPNRIVLVSLAIFIISTALKMKFGNFFDIVPKMNLSATLDVSILQIVQASSIFVLVRYLYDDVTGIFAKFKGFLESKTVSGFIESVSRASYGMYLVQMLLLREYIRPYFKPLELSDHRMFFYSCLLFVGLFLASWIITVILGKIPYVKKVSGYA